MSRNKRHIFVSRTWVEPIVHLDVMTDSNLESTTIAAHKGGVF